MEQVNGVKEIVYTEQKVKTHSLAPFVPAFVANGMLEDSMTSEQIVGNICTWNSSQPPSSQDLVQLDLHTQHTDKIRDINTLVCQSRKYCLEFKKTKKNKKKNSKKKKEKEKGRFKSCLLSHTCFEYFVPNMLIVFLID